MDKKDKMTQVLYGGFRRLGNFPIDSSSFYRTYEEMEIYLNGPLVYPGQILVVYNDADNEVENENGNGIYFAVRRGEKPIKTANSTDLVEVVRKFGIISTEFKNLDKGVSESIKKIKAENASFAADLKRDQQKTREEILEKNELHKDELEKLVNDTVAGIDTQIGETLTGIEERLDSFEEEFRNTINTDYATTTFVETRLEETATRVKNELLGIEGEMTDALDTITEIAEWIADHEELFNSLELVDRIPTLEGKVSVVEGEIVLLQNRSTDAERRLSELEALLASTAESLNSAIEAHKTEFEEYKDKIKTRFTNVEGRVSTIENAGYTTAEDVIEIVGASNLKSVVKTLTIPLDFDNQAIIENADYDLPADAIINSAVIYVEEPSSREQNLFKITLKEFNDLNGNPGEERVIFSDSYAVEYDAEMREAIGYLGRRIDLSSKGPIDLCVNFRVIRDGTLTIQYDLGGAKFKGKLHIAYSYTGN